MASCTSWLHTETKKKNIRFVINRTNAAKYRYAEVLSCKERLALNIAKQMQKMSEWFVKIQVNDLTNVVKVTSDVPLSFFKRKGTGKSGQIGLEYNSRVLVLQLVCFYSNLVPGC